MIIDTYDVRASSQREFFSVETKTLTMKRDVLVKPEEEEPQEEKDAEVTLSEQVKEMLEKQKKFHDKLGEDLKTGSIKKLGAAKNVPKDPDELKLTLLEKMIESLTGKKLRFRMTTPNMNPDKGGGQGHMTMPPGEGTAGRPRTVDGWEYEHFSYESEQLSYQAQGVVKTGDGKTINFDVSMYMSREFASYTNVFVQSERSLCDPLVVNYGGTASSLSGENFSFDLTMDGKNEMIAKPGEGNGFLALDNNGDGTINDGSELFGPQSGNGFDELRKYDGDGNNWIDENDDIFSKLLVWSKDKDGNDQLFTLKDLDIGAIYLGEVDTQFSFKDETNQTTGMMRSTSFFLKEDGGAGTVSHVDLAV